MHNATPSPDRRSFHPLAFAVLLALPCAAQPYYTFTHTQEAYTEITGGTPIQFASGWAQFTGLDGSTWWFCGQPYVFGDGQKELWLCDQGFINVDDNPVNTLFVSALFSPLQPIVAVDASSSVTYRLTGTTGHQHLVFQWKNYRRADGAAGDFVDFQVHLDQATSMIELRYGPHNDGGATYASAEGPSAGYYFANYDASTVYDRIWLGGQPGSPTMSTAHATQFNGLLANPADGTVYRFAPLFSTTGIAETVANAAPPFTTRTDASGQVLVHFNTAGEAGTLTLLDAAGRISWSSARTGDDTVVPATAFGHGMYVLDYRTIGGSRSAQRLVRP